MHFVHDSPNLLRGGTNKANTCVISRTGRMVGRRRPFSPRRTHCPPQLSHRNSVVLTNRFLHFTADSSGSISTRQLGHSMVYFPPFLLSDSHPQLSLAPSSGLARDVTPPRRIVAIIHKPKNLSSLCNKVREFERKIVIIFVKYLAMRVIFRLRLRPCDSCFSAQYCTFNPFTDALRRIIHKLKNLSSTDDKKEIFGNNKMSVCGDVLNSDLTDWEEV